MSIEGKAGVVIGRLQGRRCQKRPDQGIFRPVVAKSALDPSELNIKAQRHEPDTDRTRPRSNDIR